MRLRNKKTGEIGELSVWRREDNGELTGFAVLKKNEKFPTDYNSLAELNAEWEDYEEPKEWWYIDIHGPHKVTNNDEYYQQVKAASKEIGNYFLSREEAEDAVEKLKAWKRLKEKGFRFTGVEDVEGIIHFEIPFRAGYDSCEAEADLDICFGGEE